MEVVLREGGKVWWKLGRTDEQEVEMLRKMYEKEMNTYAYT